MIEVCLIEIDVWVADDKYTRVQKAVESLASKNFNFPLPSADPAFC